MSGFATSAIDAPLAPPLDSALAGSPKRYLFVLLHTLVAIVLSYQLLFTENGFVPLGVREVLVSALIGSILLLGMLPTRAWATMWLTGALVLVDTLATSSIIYLSGNASSNLYLTYFLIMLLAVLAPTLKQVIGLSLMLCFAHGVTLFLEANHAAGVVGEGQLLQIPVLFILAMFYGLTIDSERKLIRDKMDLLQHISEREKTEEVNQRARAFITSIVENLPNMLFVKDAQDLKFVRLNKAGEDLLGRSRDELIGKSAYDCFSEHQADFFTDQDRKALEGRMLVDIPEERLQTTGKGLRTLHTKKIPILDGEGHPQYLLSISEDITERKQAEEALRVKTEQLEAISESMTQFLQDGDWHRASSSLLRKALKQTNSDYGLMGVVKEGSILRVLACEHLSGDPMDTQPCHENLAQRCREDGHFEFTSLENLFGRVVASRQVVLSNDPDSDPHSGKLPSGLPPLRHFLGVPILHGADVVGMIGVANRPGGYTGHEQAQLEILMQAAGVLYDSYRRQQRESALEVQLRQSQQLEAIGRLAGGIAHDFNNLLTIIVGYCDFLLRRLGEDDPHQQSITRIKEAGDRASALTQQLLAFGRRQMLKPKPLDLNGVVSGFEPMLTCLIGEHTNLTIKLDPALGTVKADLGQLEQVLMNLVLNARDAMPKGGQITIETSNVEFPPSHKEGQVALWGQYAMVSVTDNGMGMDKETQARIFEPFFTTKGQGKGTGLGLATSYGIIKQSGGYIFVDSEPGRGTRFRIYLPRINAVALPVPIEQVEGGSPSGSETVLLVEDQPGVRALLCYTLQYRGYEVLEARDGHEALDISKRHVGPIHLLITDIVMPGLSGPEVADRIAQDRSNTKVLYMSGYSEDAWVYQELADGAEHFLQKPFTPDVLERKVRDVLDAPEPTELTSIPGSGTRSA